MTFLKQFDNRRITNAIEWRLKRGIKYFRQHLKPNAKLSSPIFIVGCQRSGTSMLMSVLDRQIDTWVYSDDHKKAFEKYRLKPLKTRLKLLENARARWVIFKPLCDSQNIDNLLSENSEAKAIWIYRRFQDVSNSAIRNWGGAQKHMIHNLARNEKWDHWMVEKLREEHRALVKSLYSEKMSDHTAAGLKWYLRNAIFFDNELHKRQDRIILVKYEDLVNSPRTQFENVFTFLKIPFSKSYISEIHNTSIGKNSFPEIDNKVSALCEDMLRQLDKAYYSQNNSPDNL